MSNSLINNVVSKSHELVKANYAMTVNEQRLILSAICQINSLEELLDPSAKFVVTVPQFQEIFCTDANKKNAYRDLKEAAEALFDREARVALPDNKELLTRFVQSVVFNPNENQVELRFAVEITPYLAKVYSKFTSYRIQYIAHLTSTYAIRIYELLVTWFGRDGKYIQNKIEIDELREILCIRDKYHQFGQLKDRVIDPAIEQINKNTDFIVSVDFIKHKRTYKWIEFNFERKPEIFEADKKAREQRKEREEQNLREKYKRESKEAEIRHKKEETEKLEAERLAAEAAKKVQNEEKRAWAAEAWANITEEQKRQMIVFLKQDKNNYFASMVIRGIENNDEDALFIRGFSQFYDALKSLEISPKPATNFRQPENNSEPETKVDDSRADALQLFKDGVITKEELANLLK